MPITIGQSLCFCGRELSAQQIELIRGLVRDFPNLSLTELAATVCELLDWRRPNGGLKVRECFFFLQQLQGRGWVASLPALQATKPHGPQAVGLDSRSDPGPPLSGSLREFQPVRLEAVRTPADRHLFRQYLERYHYLGYRVPYGAHLRYFVRSQTPPQTLLACLLFTSAAWKMAPRDAWIGWSDPARKRNLPRLVNHSRFLILPWVRIPHLASHVLALAARQLPQDWQDTYQSRPVLLETLVDAARFPGTCYRAANWIHVGITQGRGRMDRFHKAQGHSPKHIFLYPLCRDWRRRLCAID